MDIAEMERRFKAAVAELGLTPERAANLAQDLVQTEKAALAQGVAYKAEDAPPVYTGPDGSPGLIVDGRFVALKAAPPFPPKKADTNAADAMSEPDGMAKALGDPPMTGDVAPGDAELDDGADDETAEMSDMVGDMAVSDFEAMLAQAFTAAIAPLVKTLDISKAMGDHMNELKGMMGGYTTKEATRITAVEAKLDDLLGNQPRATPYRASQDAATVIPDTHRLKAAAPAEDPFADVIRFMTAPGTGA